MQVLTCPECHARYRLNPEFAARTVRCRHCKTRIRVPDRDSDAPLKLAAEDDTPLGRPTGPQPPLPSATEGLRQATARPSGGLLGLAKDVGRSLAFPVLGLGNLITFLIVVVIVAGAGYLWILPILGWLLYAIVIGWYMAFQFNALGVAAGGDDELPNIALEEGIAQGAFIPLFKYLAVKAVSFSPLLLTVLYLTILGQVGWGTGLELAGSLFIGRWDALELARGMYGVGIAAAFGVGWVFALVLQPMLFLMVAIGGFGGLWRIHLLVQTVFDTFDGYFLVGLVFLFSGAAELWAVDALTPDDPSVWVGPGTYALMAAATVYCDVLAMRTAGYHYHHFKDRFAWSWG